MADIGEVNRMLARVRRVLKQHVVTAEEVADIISKVKPKQSKPLKKLSRSATERIKSLLLKPGDRCIVMRKGKGVRVFSEGSIEKLSATAKKTRVWEYRGGNGRAVAPAAETAKEPA